MNYSIVSKYLGSISILVAVTLISGLTFAIGFGEDASTRAFAGSITVSIFVGLVLFFMGRNASDKMYQREALALVGF